MFFAHVIQPFSDVPYRTAKREDLTGKKEVVTSTYNPGERITALGWEGDRVLCEDGFGTFLAPAGTICVGQESSEFILPDGTCLKFFEDGSYIFSDENGPFILEEE